MLNVFARLTLLVAAAIVAVIILGFVLKVVVFAAIVAGIALAVLFVVNLFRRRHTNAAITRYPS